MNEQEINCFECQAFFICKSDLYKYLPFSPSLTGEKSTQLNCLAFKCLQEYLNKLKKAS